MSSDGILAQIDAAIAAFLGSANAETLFFASVLVAVLIWPIIMGKDPDIHPFLLARQSQQSAVRQPGESAVFRANEVPIGYPLRKGLGVKDPGAPAWSPGRDGDLRDVWRRAVEGAVDDKGVSLGQRGKFLTIHGKENVAKQEFGEVARAIHSIGSFIQASGGKTVAVSLSNSVELLATIFASAFYHFKPVLIPYGLDQTELQTLLSKSSADVLIAEAGVVQLESALTKASSIKTVIFVVKQGSMHIDWTEQPEGVGPLKLSHWHDIVKGGKAPTEALAADKDTKTGPIAMFGKGSTGQYELFEYTSENIVAGVASLRSTLLREYKITPNDILLSTASLTESYALCWTMAALFSGASIALNSVAGDSVDLALAAAGASPTLIVCSAGTIAKQVDKIAASAPGIPQRISNYFQKRNMAAGHMSPSKPGGITPNLSALRVLLISQRDTEKNTKVSSTALAGLRLALGTRTAYALTSGSVAGAVTQTNVLDYRLKGLKANVGAPLSCLELFLTGDDQDLDQDFPKGKIVVRGNSVIGGETRLDVSARIELDRTVTLL